MLICYLRCRSHVSLKHHYFRNLEHICNKLTCWNALYYLFWWIGAFVKTDWIQSQGWENIRYHLTFWKRYLLARYIVVLFCGGFFAGNFVGMAAWVLSYDNGFWFCTWVEMATFDTLILYHWSHTVNGQKVPTNLQSFIPVICCVRLFTVAILNEQWSIE